jgi:hypothetical protein
VTWEVAKVNRLRIALEGATKEMAAEYSDGHITPIECYRREGSVLRLSNLNALLVNVINVEPEITKAFEMLRGHFSRYSQNRYELQERMIRSVEAMEALLLEGWITGELDQNLPLVNMKTPWESGPVIHPNVDPRPEEVLR